MDSQGEGLPIHVQEQLKQASRQIAMAQQSQAARAGSGAHATTSAPLPGGHSHVQSGPRDQQFWGNRGGGSQPSWNHQSPRNDSPNTSDRTLFPTLGSTPPAMHAYTPRAPSGPRARHPEASQEFFRGARAGPNRGHLPFRHYQPSHLSAPTYPDRLSSPSNFDQYSQSPTHYSTFHGPSHPQYNSYSRPVPRNNNLYDPFQSRQKQLQCEYLDKLAAKTVLDSAPSLAEVHAKERFGEELGKLARSVFKNDPRVVNVEMRCYGSFASGFAVRDSDLDVLLMFHDRHGSLAPIQLKDQRTFEEALLDAGLGARLLTNTRVPILRVCQKPTPELLGNLRKYQKKQVEEESQKTEMGEEYGTDKGRLPEFTDTFAQASAKIFEELGTIPMELPLPPSPTREHSNLEYTGDVGIHCDVNFSNYVAVHNTALLRCYCKCDPRVREVGIFVKTWAKARNINTPYHGTLSSYGYLMMVLHFLMNVAKPPVIPNLQLIVKQGNSTANGNEAELFEGLDIRFLKDEGYIEMRARSGQLTQNNQSVGALLHSFFEYYASSVGGFHWMNEVISIRSAGGILTKISKGWTSAKWTGENNQIRQRFLLAIEDPFEIEHNIARTVGHSGIVAIRDEFRRAWGIINRTQLNHGVGFEWRRRNGSVGEDLLAPAGARGDLLREDQIYHKRKMAEQKLDNARKAAEEAKNQAAREQGQGREQLADEQAARNPALNTPAFNCVEGSTTQDTQSSNSQRLKSESRSNGKALLQALNEATQDSSKETNGGAIQRHGYDYSLPPRDQDPRIMPVPSTAGFVFDSRQLRDLELIKQGASGCAREGEEWNIEEAGEFGGAGIMAAMPSPHTPSA